MTDEQKEALKGKLLSLVPAAGNRISNKALIESFLKLGDEGMPQVEDEKRALYWTLRNELIENGDLETGRGYGGTVRLAAKERASEQATGTVTIPGADNTTANQITLEAPKPKEVELYEPFMQALKQGYILEYRVPRDYVLVKTAHAGSKNTGGVWTRPDIALVAVHTYPFLPNKRLEVTTFEIKKSIDDAMAGVFEALAHSAFAHRVYLAVMVDGDIPAAQAETWTRMREECDRLAIGLIKFSKADEYDTFEFISEAAPNDPDLYKVNEFIAKQIPNLEQDVIRERVR